MVMNVEALASQLIDRIRRHTSAVVAFSGGVDSAVVAAAAYRALGRRSVAWTSIGPAVPHDDREAARSVATVIGIPHVEVETQELDNPDYARNGPDRCYHCKSSLYASIRRWADDQGFESILSGTNADDLSDYRPGLQAAGEWQVAAPLAELGIGKEQVRRLAHLWKLPIADKPASPCLASRIAYGQLVTLGTLTSIEQVETFLRDRGFGDVRARVHADGLLRIEVPIENLDKLLDASLRTSLLETALKSGFRFVTLDLGGRASGSLNRVLPLASGGHEKRPLLSQEP
jgi:uncharacterized protein